MATLADLQERKAKLEAQLSDGDLSVEPALERVDRAIAARTKEIQYSRKRLDAARDAVKAGMAPEDARKKPRRGSKKKPPASGPLNRF